MTVRELTLTRVIHPEYLHDGAWLLVDHPTTRPLAHGAPDLGWEGDARLAVYLHLQNKRFTLFRLENDMEYRAVCSLPPNSDITPENINALIRRLVEIDTRRGFDPMADVHRDLEARRRSEESTRTDAITDWADKFHFTLSRSHLPGIDIVRPRMAIKTR